MQTGWETRVLWITIGKWRFLYLQSLKYFFFGLTSNIGDYHLVLFSKFYHSFFTIRVFIFFKSLRVSITQSFSHESSPYESVSISFGTVA